jgi:hypothetical protein
VSGYWQHRIIDELLDVRTLAAVKQSAPASASGAVGRVVVLKAGASNGAPEKRTGKIVYNVSKVDTITEGRHLFYGFNVIGVHGRPLISFSFETRKEAEAAHKAMLAIVATAKIITPCALSR